MNGDWDTDTGCTLAVGLWKCPGRGAWDQGNEHQGVAPFSAPEGAQTLTGLSRPVGSCPGSEVSNGTSATLTQRYRLSRCLACVPWL